MDLELALTIGVAYFVADVVKTLGFAAYATMRYRAATKKQRVFIERLQAMEQEHLASQQTATEGLEEAAAR